MIGIYKIENKLSHKLYIGQTIDFTRRVYLHLHYLRAHKHCNKYLQRAWDTDGSENFEIVLFEDLTDTLKNCDRDKIKQTLDSREKFWIQYFKSSNSKFGYNLSEGGDGATLFKERNPSYGKQKSEEVRKKISDTIRANGSHSGKNNGRYGKPVSDETRHKISVALKQRQMPEAERKRRSKIMHDLRNDPVLKERRLIGLKNAGIKNRKYSDEFINTLRDEYKNTKISITKLAEKYNIPRSSCQNIIEHLGRFK